MPGRRPSPLTNPAAPATPFAMPEYQVAHRIEAARLNKAAEASAVEVGQDIQRASNYVLTVVLYAVVLFFAGMSTKLRSRRLRTITVVAGVRGAGVHARLDRDVPGERQGLTYRAG